MEEKVKRILFGLLVSIIMLTGCDNEKAVSGVKEDTNPAIDTVLYFVDAGDNTPTDIETDQETGTLNTTIEDQQFISDDDDDTTDTTWGYYSTAGGTSPDDGSGDSADPYTVNRRGWWGLDDNATILYVFEVPSSDKKYTINVGAIMPSGWSARNQALVINNVISEDGYINVGDAKIVFNQYSVTPVDSTFTGNGISKNAAAGLVEGKSYILVEMRGNTRKGDDSGYEDPIINFIRISSEQ